MFLKKYHLLMQEKKMSAKKRQKFLNELCRQGLKQDITFRILVKEFEREQNMSRRQAYRYGHAFLFEVLKYQRRESQAHNRFNRFLAKKYNWDEKSGPHGPPWEG